MRFWHLLTGGLAIMVFASAMTLAQADDETKQKNEVTKQKAEASHAQRNRAGKLDEKTAGANVRSSELIGRNIQNPSGKSVGEISDLVIDAKDGTIRYAAVTYGGLLGIGNKMYAVPFQAFECRHDPDDRDEYVLVLDVTEKQLEGDQGFDEDHWPNFADPTFTEGINKRYKVRRDQRRADADQDRDRVARTDRRMAGSVIRASQMHGLNIQNSQGKSVGEIQELVIDANHGRVNYAAVSYGGFLGFGDKLFAVPFEAFRCQQNPDDKDEHIVVLNVTQEQLEGAKGFDQEHWPNFADRQFTNGLYERYNVKRRQERDHNKPKSNRL